MGNPASVVLRDGERIDDLRRNGLLLIESRQVFCLTTDSVLLAHFAGARAKGKVVELGSGTGGISMIMSDLAPSCAFDLVEIQEDAADMARRSVLLNGLEGRLRVHQMNMRNAAAALGRGAYQLCVCNPPFAKKGSSFESLTAQRRLAKEEEIGILELCQIASALLDNRGRFACVFPASRLYELCAAMDKSALAPKRVQMVHSSRDSAPIRVLVDAVKGGGEGLAFLPPIYLNERGEAQTL